MAIGKNIKEYRNKLNITQKDLADKLHVTYQAVSRWENEETEPSISTITQMCEIFNCTVDELLGVEVQVEEEAKKEVEVQNSTSKTVFVPYPTLINQNSKKNRTNNFEDKESNMGAIEPNKILDKNRPKQEERKRVRSSHERVEEFVEKNVYAIRRTIGLVAGFITAAVVIIIGVVIKIYLNKSVGIGIAVSSILFFTLINTIVYYNNFVAFAFEFIKDKGLFGFLGFFFDLEDANVITIILLFIGLILFVVVASVMIVIFTVLSVISLFLFPVALYRNIKHIDI